MRWIWQADRGRRYREGIGWWRSLGRGRSDSWKWPERRREAGVLVFSIRAVEALPPQQDYAPET
jgi:hypothetical protein